MIFNRFESCLTMKLAPNVHFKGGMASFVTDGTWELPVTVATVSEDHGRMLALSKLLECNWSRDLSIRFQHLCWTYCA